MISHVSVCLLEHEEKGLISNTFCYAKREHSLRFIRWLRSRFFFIYYPNQVLISIRSLHRLHTLQFDLPQSPVQSHGSAHSSRAA